MPDIEDRLRTGLATLADEVAPSEDPRAGLERRPRRGEPGRAARRFGRADAPPGGREPPELGTVVRDGATGHALGYLQGDRYCTMISWPGDRTVRPTCEPVPTWPVRPGGMLVQSREVLNGDAADDTGVLANRLVFLTDPRVATLTVRRGDGTAVAVTELGRNEHAAEFLADFAGSPDGFGYTARDSRGTVVEEAIT